MFHFTKGKQHARPLPRNQNLLRKERTLTHGVQTRSFPHKRPPPIQKIPE